MAVVKGGVMIARVIESIGSAAKKGELLRVGFLENADYPDGKSVAMVAAIQEFGAPRRGIPPRPFFRNMIAKHKGDWPKDFANIMKANKYDGKTSLALMGEHMSGQLRQSIRDTLAPPLSKTTLMLRKMKWKNPGLVVTYSTVIEARRRVARGESYAGVSTKPLVWTGHMLNSVNYEVR
jgi:hypothetical protein